MKVAGAKPKLKAVDTPLFIRLGEMELTPTRLADKGLSWKLIRCLPLLALQVRVSHLWLSIWRSALHQAKTTTASP